MVALFLALGVVLPAAAATPGAMVQGDPGLERWTQRAQALLPGLIAEVEARLGWAYSGRAPELWLVRGYDRTCQVAEAQVPEWAVGVARPDLGRIVVRVDLLQSGYGGSLEAVLRHEWVHLSWGTFAGEHRRTLPLWAEEGLAEEIGGGLSVDAGAALDLAAAFGNLMSFQDLASGFPADARAADLAYKQSRSWIRYFVSRAGWGSLTVVLREIASGEAARLRHGRDAFGEALRRHSGLSLGEWHVAWRQDLEEASRPLFHLFLRDFPGLLLTCIAVVGIGAFVVLLRRRRREIEALPDAPLPREPDSGAPDG